MTGPPTLADLMADPGGLDVTCLDCHHNTTMPGAALLPRYAAQGKSYVNLAFGCTGGRHRSVHTAEAMAQALRGAGFSPTVVHRNLGSRAADQLEGLPQS